MLLFDCELAYVILLYPFSIRVILLNVILPGVILLSVILPSVIQRSIIRLTVIIPMPFYSMSWFQFTLKPLSLALTWLYGSILMG
jgi:hypothetical protein